MSDVDLQALKRAAATDGPEEVERYRRALSRITPPPAIEDRVLEVFKELFSNIDPLADHEQMQEVMASAVDLVFVMRAEINRLLDASEEE